MKNKLLLLFGMFFLTLSAHHESYAASNKELLDNCRTVVNANFDFRNTSQGEQEWDYMYCLGYFNAIRSQFAANCSDVNRLEVWQSNSQQTETFREFYSAGINDTDAVIQAFVNWAPTSPGNWEYTASSTAWEWLPKIFPCTRSFVVE